MSHRFAVVYEAPADHRTATELADRVLLEAINWLDEQHLPDQRDWVVEIDGEQLMWKRISKLAKAADIEVRGYFQGQPGFDDAIAARRAIAYLKATCEDISGILLLRDQDDYKDRRLGLEQARLEHQVSPQLVIGLAVVERETWVISGFMPQDDAERVRIEIERKRLGFNPCEKSHELTAPRADTHKRSPKLALRNLTDGDPDRERACWKETPLDVLRQRGEKNGLKQYLDEIKTRIAPFIGHVPGVSDS